MARKKKVDINGSPLTSIPIGKIDEHRFSLFWLFFLIAIFGGIIYFLPEINKLYLTYFGTNTIYNPPVVSNNTIQNNTVTNEIEYNELNNSKETVINNIIFSAITNDNYQIMFSITNSSNDTINLQEEEIYFETFDSQKELLNVFELNDIINAGQTIQKEYSIDNKSIYYLISEITEDDYTYISLDVDETGKSVLTCDKDNESYAYTFINDKLSLVEYNYLYSRSNADYQTEYERYNAKLNEYRDIDGINVSLSSNLENLTYKIILDYNDYKDTFDDYYFSKNSSPIVVNFKMTANSFHCS